MGQQTKFCGACGVELKPGARFCGACGWQVPLAEPETVRAVPPEAARVPDASAATPAARAVAVETPRAAEPATPPEAARVEAPAASSPHVAETPAPATFSEILGTAVTWGIVWLIGWVPAGLFMGFFWVTNRERHAELYEMYSSDMSWGYTIPGAATGFALAGLIGGAIAGGLLRWHVPQAGGGKRLLVVVLLWLVGWVVVLGAPGASFVAGGSVSDDILMLSIFTAAPIIALVAAQVAMARGRSGGGRAATKRQRFWVSLGWMLAAVIGSLCTIIVIDF